MAKTNPMLAQFEAKLEARYQRKIRICTQMGLDVAMIVANELLGLGPGRAEAFRVKYITTMNEMAALLARDGADDADLDWSREVIDRRLRPIMGDIFRPWDERYV